MRSRLILLGLLPLALVLAACGGASTTTATSATPATTVASKTKTMTIRVTSVVRTTRSHRRSSKVTTAGDRVEFVDDLVNAEPRFGKNVNEKVGSDRGTMTFTSKTSATMKGVATLPDGTIVFDGTVTVFPNKTLAVPVTGGTGKYENASGTLLVGSGSKRAMNMYTLVIAGVPGPVA